MEASYCLDTDVLIDFLRPATIAIIILEKSLARIATTAINIFELYYRALRSSRAKENLKAIDELLEKLEVIKLDREIAELAARHLRELESKGELLDLADLFIGCAALSRRMTLVTWNLEHFSRIKGLNLAKPDPQISDF
ncbi:MAG: type II toxin-antitoxin system VapC family toxin [Candidatus Methanodesulfokora sp.]|jgi:predicted nucleic acid-binding protein